MTAGLAGRTLAPEQMARRPRTHRHETTRLPEGRTGTAAAPPVVQDHRPPFNPPAEGASGQRGLAVRCRVGATVTGRRRSSLPSAVALPWGRNRARRGPGPDPQPVLHRRPAGTDPDQRLLRRLAFGAQCPGDSRDQQRRCCRSGQFRPPAPAPVGDQRRRTQLPRYLLRPRFAAGVDPGDEPGGGARRVHPAQRAGGNCRRACREPGRRRDVDRRLRCGHHPARSLRAGRWLHLGGRGRSGYRRWLRQFLQGVRQRGLAPAGG